MFENATKLLLLIAAVYPSLANMYAYTCDQAYRACWYKLKPDIKQQEVLKCYNLSQRVVPMTGYSTYIVSAPDDLTLYIRYFLAPF